MTFSRHHHKAMWTEKKTKKQSFMLCNLHPCNIIFLSFYASCKDLRQPECVTAAAATGDNFPLHAAAQFKRLI